MYTKEQMFMMFQEGRRTANIAFPYSLYQEFESYLEEMTELGKKLNGISHHPHGCGCSECHSKRLMNRRKNAE